MGLVTVILVGFAAVAAAIDDGRLVTCQQPVDLRFIANPGQEKPEFSEDIVPGQKHWWSYGCKLSDIAAGPDTRPVGQRDPAQERKLWFHSAWYWQCELYNETYPESGVTFHSSDWKWFLTNGPAPNCTFTSTTTTTTTAATTSTALATPDPGTSTTKGNTTNGTSSGSAATTTTAGTQEAEASLCVTSAWNTMVAGLSLSLPFVMADVPSKKDVIDVLLPCSALISPLKDLDGDGQLDCKMTKEQSRIAQAIPALEGNWKIATAHTVAHGRRIATTKLQGDNITITDGAMCTDIAPDAAWSFSHHKEKIDIFQNLLPVAVANIAEFTHNGQRCSEGTCEASMWSFDLTYPTSECTPDLPGWVRPCTAKMMPNGQLVLIRGESATAGTVATRPPLLEDIESVHDVLPFANGLAAAAQSEFEVLVLQKEGHGRHKAFVEADVDANGALSFTEFESAISKLPSKCADAF